ncbi:hypothetical protein [Tunicatimonas pelagia]|uniref:hypothetical protein n=1 Tax=Tunicatimonas pelagia TaxID=931531 RepID=UPI0026653EBB|nr:hypothetical protein [Tunicatimonas pelagia]WKN43509.1 hypothetical protein P0M28_00815 [Tunicatimonas pelagia]
MSVVLIALLCLSCEEKEEVKVDDSDTYEDWIKLTIPDEREAFAVFGDIDRTLTVTTWTESYFTRDRGNTWKMSHDFQGSVVGLLMNNDTLFALHATRTDSLGNKSAVLAQHYSLDTGQTWHSYHDDYVNQYIKQMDTDTTSQGIVYELRKNVTDNYVNPSDLLRSDGAFSSPVDVPFKHYFHDVYVDQNDRVYVAASGDQHNPEDNTLVCCFDALLYVSKHPNPIR